MENIIYVVLIFKKVANWLMETWKNILTPSHFTQFSVLEM